MESREKREERRRKGEKRKEDTDGAEVIGRDDGSNCFEDRRYLDPPLPYSALTIPHYDKLCGNGRRKGGRGRGERANGRKRTR